jgi:unsaturated chondroitin disaccharide hydrolase
MMDTLMNAPLLFWSAEQTGNKAHYDAALSQEKITERLLIRADASSFHHYQFEPDTYAPRCGVTWQGHTDDSCWSRGHSWGIYGFPIAYSYCREEWLLEVHRDITYYMLNHLPDDLVPYWDYDFVSGDEPRDASAGVISSCGLLEMARNLDDSDVNKTIFRSAAAQMLEALIDKCTDGFGEYDDGILNHVTAALPQRIGIDQSAVYGDYFYLEALLRYKNPDFKMYW